MLDSDRIRNNTQFWTFYYVPLTYYFMPRAKFYPHEKVLHDLRLKQDVLPESIQNQINNWKESKTKTGYHQEYVETSNQIVSLIQEWQNEPSLYSDSDEFDSIGSNMNDSEMNEETENLEQEQIDAEIEELEKQLNEADKTESLPNHSDTQEIQESESIVNDSELEKHLSCPIPNQQNVFYNSLNKIEKLCYDLLKEVKESQIEHPVFSLEYLQSKGLNTGFWSNFSKLAGYEGKHYDIIRVSSTPLYFQIKSKS